MTARWKGEEFRELMKLADLSPAAFAGELKVSITTLYRLFRDDPVHKNTRDRVEESASRLRSRLKAIA